jgi:hypothetical protein
VRTNTDKFKYDITVRVSDGTTGLKAKLCFRPDFLSLDEMDRLVLFFGSIIDEIIVNPTTRISDIKLPIRSDLGTV